MTSSIDYLSELFKRFATEVDERKKQQGGRPPGTFRIYMIANWVGKICFRCQRFDRQ